MAKPPKNPTRGIIILVSFWLLCILAAVACYYLITPQGPSQDSASYGLNRAIPILALVGIAFIDAIITIIQTFRRRRNLSAGIKSLGYMPFFFSTGAAGTLIHRILSE